MLFNLYLHRVAVLSHTRSLPPVYIHPCHKARPEMDWLVRPVFCIEPGFLVSCCSSSSRICFASCSVATPCIHASFRNTVPTRLMFFALLPGCQKFPIGSADETIRSLQVNPEKRTVLPKVAFSGYSSRFKAPEMSEGFDEEVIRIDFQVGSPFRTTTCF
jgi:hypothetical protein